MKFLIENRHKVEVDAKISKLINKELKGLLTNYTIL